MFVHLTVAAWQKLPLLSFEDRRRIEALRAAGLVRDGGSAIGYSGTVAVRLREK